MLLDMKLKSHHHLKSDELQNFDYSINDGTTLKLWVDPDTGNVRYKNQYVKAGKLFRRVLNVVNIIQDSTHIISDQDAKEYSEFIKEHISRYELRFIESDAPGSEWVRVYRDGPRSCMSGMDCVKVYASGDFKLAHLVDLTGDPDVDIVARCIVSSKDKIRSTCYGLNSVLSSKLEKLGYKHAMDDFTGHRLNAIESEYGDYIAPYSDSVQSAELSNCGKYLVLSHRGDLMLDGTNGTTNDEHINCCECCGYQSRNEDDFDFVEDQYFCRTCIENNYVWSDAADCYIHVDDAVSVDCKRTGDTIYFSRDDDQVIYCYISRDPMCTDPDICLSNYTEYRIIDAYGDFEYVFISDDVAIGDYYKYMFIYDGDQLTDECYVDRDHINKCDNRSIYEYKSKLVYQLDPDYYQSETTESTKAA